MKIAIKLFAFLLAALVNISLGFGQSSKENGDLTHWTQGKSPQEIGKIVAERFIANSQPNNNRSTPPKSIAYPETSSTGMFTFAMITGVKNGWLDKKTYAPAARKAWLALISYLNENGDIREVCAGTGKKNDHQYYIDRPRIIGDLHGQAPVLWCASALLRRSVR